MRSNNINGTRSKWKVALEDTVVTFLIVFAIKAVAMGGVPTIDQIWEPVWSAVLMALYSWARSRGIKVEPTSG